MTPKKWRKSINLGRCRMCLNWEGKTKLDPHASLRATGGSVHKRLDPKPCLKEIKKTTAKLAFTGHIPGPHFSIMTQLR